MILRRVGPLSVARLAGVLYGALGLIIGGIISLLAMVSGLAPNGTGSGGFGAVFGAAAIVLLPILYGLIGFFGTLIGSWLYNLLASVVGGIELDLQ